MSIDTSGPAFERLREEEQRLGIGVGFFESLLVENDWSMVVKVSAALEATFTPLLLAILNRPPESKLFPPKMSVSEKRRFLAVLLREYRLELESVMKFCEALAELRNACVHDVSALNIDLRSYLPTFKKASALGMVDDREGVSLMTSEPRLAIWFGGAFAILTFAAMRETYSKHHSAMSLRTIDQDRMQSILREALLSQMKGDTPD